MFSKFKRYYDSKKAAVDFVVSPDIRMHAGYLIRSRAGGLPNTKIVPDNFAYSAFQCLAVRYLRGVLPDNEAGRRKRFDSREQSEIWRAIELPGLCACTSKVR